MSSYNLNYFSLIIWNPALYFKNDIIREIPNIQDIKEIEINKGQLHNFIFEVYKLDTRCSHNIVLPPKIARLKEHGDNHLLIKFEISNPIIRNGVCDKAVTLKEIIRAKYREKINNYIKDIIVHVADNYEQSRHIWGLGGITNGHT